jgi:hypothetical protein
MNSWFPKLPAQGWARIKRTASKVGLATLLLLLPGCANVQPWQRGALIDYSMRPDRDQVEASLSEHMWFSREAASGGRAVGGGGCGCN